MLLEYFFNTEKIVYSCVTTLRYVRYTTDVGNTYWQSDRDLDIL